MILNLDDTEAAACSFQTQEGKNLDREVGKAMGDSIWEQADPKVSNLMTWVDCVI